ncbi:DUF2294 domain-containing protein [Chroogloeocystis siderophila]|uniref:Na+-translocating membrane potential-generating system MpsC domain-containing protein n=1 Tax=Chroogloeocystis siderophila 5.2 s.c.1 TaxID=247279 RepID=A0A1U7HV84_9CHRO|nr:DUF2294 domain-containing protein [Chroogloeocystis siderophila]OKH27487.1 hypothetical protein NIES1031_09435 [Chroogloeocystis siderophila 5.2 s.c.1]
MEENIPTNCIQLEAILAQQIQALYFNLLGHLPEKVVCNLSNQNLTVIVEHPTTPPERLLLENRKNDLAQEVGWNLYKAIEPQLKQLIEEVLDVSAVDMLGSSNIDSDRTSIIVVLAAKPV